MTELWLFDVESYKWQRVDFKDFDPQPPARSGCQLVVHGDQVFMYGGYARDKNAAAGNVFDDLWALSACSPFTVTAGRELLSKHFFARESFHSFRC